MNNRASKSHQFDDALSINGRRVDHYDAYNKLIIDGTYMDLTPTEYLLVMLLLHHYEQLQSSERMEVFVGYDELQQGARLPNRSVLSKHITNASKKLWAVGWAIVPVKSYGYTLVFDALGDADRYRVQSSQNEPRAGRDLQFVAAL
jgi:DNA-binding response OmpR family regulator